MTTHKCPVCHKPFYPQLGDVPAARAADYCEHECEGHSLGRRIVGLESELETTADKLSDVWLVLDGWARCDIVPLREHCKAILRRQQAPGWKGEQ